MPLRARKAHTAVCVEDHTIFFFGGLSVSDDPPPDKCVIKQARGSLSVSNQVNTLVLRDMSFHSVVANGSSPMARCSHCSAYHEGSIYVFGHHAKKCPLLYAFNVAFASWKTVEDHGERPDSVCGASLCVAGNMLLLFGGENSLGVSNTLYAFDTESAWWSRIEDSTHAIPLLPRRDHSATVFDDRMLVFGGFSMKSDELEFVQFSVGTKSWSNVVCSGAIPEKRGAHCCAQFHNMMIIYGGMHHEAFLSDLCVFDCYTGVWTAVECTSKDGVTRRAFAASTIGSNYWYVHGGNEEENYYRDLQRIDLNEIARKVNPAFVPVGEPTDGTNGPPSSPKKEEKADDPESPPSKKPKPLAVRYNVVPISPLWCDLANRNEKVVMQ